MTKRNMTVAELQAEIAAELRRIDGKMDRLQAAVDDRTQALERLQQTLDENERLRTALKVIDSGHDDPQEIALLALEGTRE